MDLTGFWAHRPADIPRGGFLGAAWGSAELSPLARFLLSLSRPILELRLSSRALLLLDHSLLGTFSRELLLDGAWRAIPQPFGPPRATRAVREPGTGAVRVESRCGRGTLVETLRRASGTELRQALEFTPAEGSGGAAEAAERCWDWVRGGAAGGGEALTRAEGGAHAAAAAATAEAQAQAQGAQIPPPAAQVPPPLAKVRVPIALEQGGGGADAGGAHQRGGAAALPAAAPPPAAAAWEPPNFSGSWRIVKDHSDSLDPILQLMGVPWLAIKLASAVDVLTVVDHSPALRTVNTTDRTSLGVLSTNSMIADGQGVDKKGADGRFARITCMVTRDPPQGHPLRPLPAAAAQLWGAASAAGSSGGSQRQLPLPPPPPAVGYMRIITELPNDIGVTDNVWALYEGGQVMQAHLVFKKPGGGMGLSCTASCGSSRETRLQPRRSPRQLQRRHGARTRPRHSLPRRSLASPLRRARQLSQPAP